MYPIYKVTYGNFDVRQEELVAISRTVSGAATEADRLNSKLTKAELLDETTYEYDSKQIRIVD